MPAPISSLTSVPSFRPTTAIPPATTDSGFGGLLTGSLQQTAALEQNAQSAILQSLTGGDVTQVEVLTAVKQADLSLRMLMQIRNKAVEAWKEIQNLRM